MADRGRRWNSAYRPKTDTIPPANRFESRTPAQLWGTIREHPQATEKGDGVQVLMAEKLREDDLRASGFDFHRAFAEDLFAQPDREMDRIRARL